jgi:hypothetical protein
MELGGRLRHAPIDDLESKSGGALSAFEGDGGQGGSSAVLDRERETLRRCGAGRLESPQTWNSEEPRRAWPVRTRPAPLSVGDGVTSLQLTQISERRGQVDGVSTLRNVTGHVGFAHLKDLKARDGDTLAMSGDALSVNRFFGLMTVFGL